MMSNETLRPLTLLNELCVKKVLEFARNDRFDHASLLALSEHQCRTEEMEKFVFVFARKEEKFAALFSALIKMCFFFEQTLRSA